MCNTLGSHHVQHVVCPVEGTAQLSFTEMISQIYFIFILFAESETIEGKEKSGVPRKNPDDMPQEMLHEKA